MSSRYSIEELSRKIEEKYAGEYSLVDSEYVNRSTPFLVKHIICR